MARFVNTLLKPAVRALDERMPKGWRSRLRPDVADLRIDARLEIRAPDGTSARLSVRAKERWEPRDVVASAKQLLRDPVSDPLLLVGRFLSPSVRERLREQRINYVDLAGNISLRLNEPCVFVEVSGAETDNSRTSRRVRSLKGVKAGRIVFSLIANKAPPQVRALAQSSGTNQGYVSRILAFLEAEALVTRDSRGRLESVDWRALLRRWAKDAPLSSRGQVTSMLDPHGIERFRQNLGMSGIAHVLTGSLAAARYAPIAPTRLAMVYVQSVEVAKDFLNLREVDSGGNVIVIVTDNWPPGEPFADPNDDFVFNAHPAQAAADLLSSPGRGPSEAEALMDWMAAYPEKWRHG